MGELWLRSETQNWSADINHRSVGHCVPRPPCAHSARLISLSDSERSALCIVHMRTPWWSPRAWANAAPYYVRVHARARSPREPRSLFSFSSLPHYHANCNETGALRALAIVNERHLRLTMFAKVHAVARFAPILLLEFSGHTQCTHGSSPLRGRALSSS